MQGLVCSAHVPFAASSDSVAGGTTISQCLLGVPPHPLLPTSPSLSQPCLSAHRPSLLSARAPEPFPEDAQKMQQLVPQVGLNPSQGALLPKSGERCPRAGSGLQELKDPRP